MQNILSKPLAALPHNHYWSNVQHWESIESCRYDYLKFLGKNWPSLGVTHRPTIVTSSTLSTESLVQFLPKMFSRTSLRFFSSFLRNGNDVTLCGESFHTNLHQQFLHQYFLYYPFHPMVQTLLSVFLKKHLFLHVCSTSLLKTLERGDCS